jgi:hypothetical protein
MKTYQPKIRAFLVKVVNRKEVAPGMAAASDRYAANAGFELTDYLGQNGGIRLAKGVREPAGAFSVTLSDRPHSTLLDTIYSLIEPMDMIEFRVAHDPYEYANPGEGYKLPIVMRGLVSNISRSESMQGGRPVRNVTVSGQDFGKVLQMIQIFYQRGAVVGEYVLNELGFFQKYLSSGDAKHMPAAEFVLKVVEKVAAPYLARMLVSTKAAEVGAQKLDWWGVKATIPGTVSPFAAASLYDISLYQMLVSLLDIGPLNELFIQDEPQGIALVARPAPLKTVGGKWIQKGSDGKDATTESITLRSEDVMSISVSRSDSGVANYYWVENERWLFQQGATARMAAMGSSPDTYVKFGYPNCDASIYGIRKMEIGVTLGPPDYLALDGAKETELNQQTGTFSDWLESRRNILSEINKDNVVFEHGVISVRGNERLKAGMYVTLLRGVGQVASEYYITRVEHDFRPMQGYFTTLHVERGTSFIERAARPNPINLAEIDAGGVV